MLNSLGEQLLKAFQSKNYKDAGTILDNLEKMLTPSLLGLPGGFEWLMIGLQGCISELKASCLALSSQPQDALKQHEEAMEKLKSFGAMIEMFFGPGILDGA
jgi:hypothetical protein